ncbi:non-ribosomal peptide synthase/polyketide synthase, partial [Xenorhabdus cabanillasii]|uniref:non-ribosomal peptide synthase/polyketide synthase n=1 Tax=Xenorhabdus cabanillasii TaxID=351673 RepID=UPI00056FE313
ALDCLIARHESLRTRFILLEEQPCQHISPADIGFALSCQDLRQSAPEEQAHHITELITLEAQTPFDLTQGPLIRGQLLQLADEEHMLLLTLHHIITDGWSVSVLVHELGAFYRAALDGDDALLPPLPIQYADYAIWQHDRLQEETFAEQRNFWCQQLAGAPALLDLPTDRPRPPAQTYAGSQVSFELDVALLTSLKRLGQHHNTTLFMTLLTAWSIVLARLSGQNDIVTGTPVANRRHQALEGLIGFFVNTLALRVTLDDTASVTDLLTQVRERALAAYTHQDLPFEQVVEALQPERSLSYSPIFQVMLALNNTPAQVLSLPGLQLSAVEQVRHSTQFDLTLSLSETDVGLLGNLEYATDLFDSETIERVINYLQNVLTEMVADPTQMISCLPMLPESERQQLLTGFNTIQADFPQDALIHQLFESQAEHYPDATAVIFEQQTISYGELNRRANQLAHHLIGLGVRPDNRVAICVERSLDMVVSLLAILKAGGAYVPLDPTYPAERLVYMLEDAAPVVLLTQTTLIDKLEGFVDSFVITVVLDDQKLPLTTYPTHNPDAQALGLTPRHLAYVIYTSGSTGKPKGVMIEHANVIRLLAATQTRFQFDSDDVWTLFHSFAFDFSVWEIWGALSYGGRLVVIPADCARSPQMFYALLCREQVTILNQTPSAFRQLISVQDDTHHALRCIIFGGEALELHTLTPWVARNPTQQTRLVNMYGITEITVHATYRELTEADIYAGRGSLIGQPLADLRTYILDTYGQPVPVGVTGEIYIVGAGVARGYLNRPELTAERFLIDPFFPSSKARMYKTGDLGRWLPDGTIEYLGRNDFQVKLRGFRIELGEIEARLMQCHGVREAVVLAREDISGENTAEKRLVAYLRPLNDIELVPAELRQQLSQHLAEYMLPSAFVILDTFPLTPNGKLDRQALPAPDSSALATRVYAAPSGEAEIALAHIWQNLLGLEQVGRHDHFFELGGHSLMIVSLIERLRNLGWQLDVRSVFTAPTLADMAQVIRHNPHTLVESGNLVVPGNLVSDHLAPANRIPADCTTITPDMLPLVSLTQTEIDAITETIPGGASNVQDIYPLAPLQEGILFHYLLQEQGDDYLLQSLLAFDTRGRLDAFLIALQQVIDRHDILRTSAYWQGLVQPVQVVWRQAPLHINNFTPATVDDVPAQLRAYTDPKQNRLDLSHAPLFAADIAYDPAQEEWLLALRFHHLVSDHMTLELVFAEIAQIQQGRAAMLPEALPYRNFIAQTLSVPISEHEAYFRTQLADIDEPTAPFGILSVKTGGALVTEARLPIAPALAEAIRIQARRLGVSPGVLFHAGWAQVLAQTSGRNDVVFGSVLLGRLQGGIGADRVLGMFINTLPIRISLTNKTIQEVVQAAYHNLMLLLEHEQAPLSLAQQCSNMAQSAPLFSTLFNYRHNQVDTADTVNTTWAGMRVLGAEERTNYPITLSVDDLGTCFQLTAQTVDGIDPTRVTAYLATAMRGLVDALAHNPQQLIRDIPVLPPEERQQLLVDFNATQTDFPQDSLIHQLLEAQAVQRPDAIAVTFEEQMLSYGELNCRANCLAHYLIELGVRPDDRVAICTERSLDMVVGLLAILKAGGAYVPLDPTYPAERLAYMFEDAAPVVLLTQTAWSNTLDSPVPVVLLDVQDPAIATQPTDNPKPQALGLTSRHLAYVIYTSGSSGLPKGVMVEHRNVLRLIINNGFVDIGPDDCIAHCANVAFDASTWEIWSALLNGGRLHVIPQSTLLNPESFRHSLIRGQVTALWLTAGLFNEYLDDLKSLFGQLRYLLIGGDVLDPGKIRRAQLAESQPAHLINGYGPTETTTFAATYAITSLVDAVHSIPIGRPIANTQIYILDAFGQPVPLGVAGEIYIAGAGVARGYLNRPELTTERFLPDPFSANPDARMYKTGDLGRWRSDGNIDYLGRNDFQVKIRGFRIELGEIEARLTQCHGVREAVVLAREDISGENTTEKRLVAYLLPSEGVELVPAELRQQLAHHLADYMLPGAFVTLESFPLTPNGKLDRQALPVPDLSAMIVRGYEAPIGKTEIMLARIWQELLGVERISRHDHFFELGGHSLLAVQLAARIRQELAQELPLQQLFAQPILMDLAHTLIGNCPTSQIVIPAADRNQPLPLSFAQQRLWFLGQLDEAASQAYHIPAALHLTGLLDRQALTTALDRLVIRHESLRTHFVLIEGQPCQHIEPANIGFTLSSQDLRLLTPEERAHYIAELAALEARTPFDFVHGPLIRGQLLQLADEEHVLLITQHHIISDGWSVGVLIHELGAFYRAVFNGHDEPLPPLPIQYADYAAWQRNWLQGTVFAEQLDFWRHQLQGAPALLTLPIDRPRPSVQSYAGDRVPLCIDAALLTSLKALGKRHNTTLFMTLLTAWSIVLARLSGQDDIVIGTPVANRPYHELENLIGFFVNTLALRVTLSDAPNIAGLLAQVRERALAAYAHQDFPFEQVVESLQPDRSLSYSPIFQVMLALNNTPAQTLSLPGLQLSAVEQVRHGAHFDLMLSLTETEAGLVGDLEYASDLFDTATIERMVGYLIKVLAAMATDATQAIATLPMLPETEQQQLLVDFNATQADFPQNALIHQLFEKQAELNPDATAVICGEQSLSYGTLNCRANQLAHHLITLGVRPDDRVAMCVERSLEMVIGLLAILKAGAAYVPLDPTYPAERLTYMLEDATPAVLLTQTAWRNVVSYSGPVVLINIPKLDTPESDTQDPCVAMQPDHNPVVSGLTPHHLAYVVYTSGSTGLPKGVMNSHRALCNRLLWFVRDIVTAPLVAALKTSISFVDSVTETLGVLLSGGKLVVFSNHEVKDLDRFGDSLRRFDVNYLVVVPSLLKHLIQGHSNELKSIRTLVCSGERLAPELARQVVTNYPWLRLLNFYGSSEVNGDATWYEYKAQAGIPEASVIGQPIANTQIYILDPHGQPVPLGVTGEIHIAGAGIARGYLNRPELTAESFLVDPFSSDPNARMYKTGDLGRWLPDGNIDYLGRNDFQVKLRGFRIEPGEIEAKLMQCHGIREAVVLAREDEPEQTRLVAYLRPLDGVELVPAELRRQLAQHLAEYMLPSAYVILEAFPLTPNGKLHRQAFPAPDQSAIVTRSYEAPVSEIEIALAQIWQDLLGLEQVGRHDHFFELGGHSLMIVNLIGQLRSLGWRLDVRSVFATPVLAELAQSIQAHQDNTDAFVVPPNLIPENCTAITPDMLTLVSLSQTEIDAVVGAVPGGVSNIQDIYPLAPLQEGILFHHLLQTQGDDYLLQTLLAFNTRQRLDTFLSALQQVIDRHDILRTAVYWRGLAQPVQVVWRQALLHVNSFTPATPDDVLTQLRAHTDPRRRRFDLNHAPLFAADIAYDPVQDEWLLALRFHHLVSDNMTMTLIFAEIVTLSQKNAALLPAALPYRDFIAQTLNVPTSVHEAYFRNQLADVNEPTAPFGVLKVQDDNEPVIEAFLPLEPTLAEAIRTQARRLGVSPSVLFHVAWALVLAQTSGQDDVVFGSVLLGRLQGGAGADRVLGMFINTLPIRISLAEHSVQEIVQTTYRSLTMLLEHEQAPLTLAQRCSGVVQPMPLFSALLNYRHSQTSEADTTWAGMRVIDIEQRTNYPVTLSVDDLGVDFRLSAQTVTRIDPNRLTTYLAIALRGLVDALALDPQQPALQVPILPGSERQQLLTGFNTTQADFPQDALIHPLFEALAANHPDTTAVVFEEQILSYGELNCRANQLAYCLIAQGVRPDDRVAICAERSLEMVVSLLAILKAGGAYVPLDPTYPMDRLNYILTDSEPVLVLTHNGLQNHLPETDVPVWIWESEEFQKNIANQRQDNLPVTDLGLTSRHLAYVLYTSGSTGLPKGVMNEHRSVVNRLLWAKDEYQLNQSDRILQKTPFSFDVSVWEFFLPLLSGAQLVMARPDGHKDPHYLLEEIESRGITTIHFVPSMLQSFIHCTPAGRCLSLRQILCSGEALSYSLQQQCMAHFAHSELHNLYGPTEAAIDVTSWRCTADRYAGLVPIGHPIANTQIYILDKHGQPVPVGIAGEIHIGGVGVARGYLNRPELTAERFISDPFSNCNFSNNNTDARMYKTGDLGRWLPDGNIEYLGRNDFQVKLRGFRIEPGEIETRLAQCHGVREAVVLAREDASYEKNGEQKRLVAYILPLNGVELDPAELRQQLARHLAEYMLPGAFVILDAFPLTPNGKLDRRALPAPDQSAVVTRGYEAPIGGTETALSQIWQDLLGLEQVGRYDHFFELGGHSLMIISLIERLRNIGWQLDVRSVFSVPVLADMAQVIQRDTTAFVVPANRIPANCSAITPDMLPLVSLSQTDIDAIVEVIPDGAKNIQDIYPLVPLQEGILFHHLLEPNRDHYIMSLLFSVENQQKLDAFVKALQAVIDRHDILRTSIHWAGLPQPIQVVHRHAQLPVNILTFDDDSDIVANMQARMGLSYLHMDLSHAPLMRLQVATDPHSSKLYVLFQLHHLIDDNLSLRSLLAETAVFLMGSGHDLPPSVPYRNFVAYACQEGKTEEAEAFFRTFLADTDGITAPFGLTDIKENDACQTGALKVLDAELSHAIRDTARRLGTNPAILFHAAWALVVARTSGRDDILFGTVLSGRMSGIDGSARALGMFINTLPLRLKLKGNSVAEFIEMTSDACSNLLRYEQTPLSLAQRCSGLSGMPLFSALLNFRHSHFQGSKSDTPNLALFGLTSLGGYERTNYPFEMSIDDDSECFMLSAQTVNGIDPDRINSYLTQAIEQLISALVEAPNTPVLALDVLPATERQQLLVNFNATQTDFPQDALIHQLFEVQAAQYPDITAVVYGDQSLSYGELNCRANRLAHHLITLGVRPDDRIAICVERSLDMVVGLLGILKAGGAYVPLDPAYPTERLAYMFEDAAPVALLTQTVLVDKFARSVPAVLLDTQQSLLETLPDNNPDAQILGLTSRHLAYVIYTSGSTGLPKGVAIPHRNTVNFLTWAQRTFSPEELAHTLFATSLNFDLAVYECFAPLISGGTVHLVSDVLSLVTTEHPVSLINTVPSAISHLLEVNAVPMSVKTINLAGEALKPHVVEHLFARSSVQDVCNLYGPSETTTYSTWTRMNRSEGFANHIGRPIANTQIYILDSNGQPVPLGVAGEIHIAGAGVARGYLNHPELTAERFLADPFSPKPDARMYKTGDLGRWLSDGNIEYLGRNDFQVKLRGFRIELGEIETQLAQCHGIREAIVLLREDEPDHKRLVAYLRPLDGAEPTPAELRQQLAQHLADYMLPSAFVTLDAFPVTPNGKLDRRALPVPDASAVVTRRYEAPMGETETRLAQIWQDLLGLERVGRHDHFFELGGHSLFAVQLAARVRQVLGRELSLQQLFAQPLLADLAQTLTNALVTTQVVIPAIDDRSRPFPLSFAQRRLWFLGQLDPAASLAYHIPVLLRLTGQLDQQALIIAFERLIVRHESLRTRFILIEGQPCQYINNPADSNVALSYQDLRSLTPEAHTQHIADLTVIEAQTPFEFSQGSLLRVQLLQLADETHMLLLTLHHIIADGWSIGVLEHELDVLYHAVLNDQDDPLPPLTIQYADYAVWQRDCLQATALPEQRDFWQKQLAGAPALLSLPTDRPRPPVQTYTGGQVLFHLDATLLASLKTVGQRHNTTLFMTILAAWSIVLARLSGQDDIVIGTPVANRPHSELEGLIGFFVNTLALRITLDDTASVTDLLTQVRERALAAYAHQDLPFEQVVEALQPERSLSYSPIFQVMLALDNTPARNQTSPGLQIVRVEQTSHSAHFDLLLLLTETDAGLTGGLEYAADLFDCATVERMVGYLTNILTAMVADETQRIATLPMLPETERQQLLVEFNATKADFPQDALIHQLVETQVARTPGATAVVCGEQSLSYEELNCRANRLAHHLIAQGIQPDDRVAICVERNLEMVVGLLAILKAGGAYVPLDPAYPSERLAYMLEDAKPIVLLTQTTLVEKLNTLVPAVILDDQEAFLTSQPAHNPDVQALGLTSRHLAYVIYTSGSTGQPKGVAITHCNTMNFLTWVQRTFSPEELSHTLFATSLNFDLAVYECFAPLISGGTVHLVPDVLSLVTTEHPVSLINTVPSAIAHLLEVNAVPVTTQTVNLAGEALKPHVVEHLFTRSSVQNVCNLYGPSETTTYSTWTRMNRTAGFVSHIGRPIANTQIYILDRHGQPVPLGVTGEIHIAGAGVARGYLNRPELTAERFLPDPFSPLPDARMYKTGDLGRWLPDGHIEYLGRNDFQIKLRGFRIEPGEIEARLMQCHGVREAVVLARDYISDENVASEKRLVAYVRPLDGIELAPASLRQQLARHLAEYMLPSAFVILDAFPLTPNGKLDHQALPEPDVSAVVARGYETPVGEIEITLAEIWQELLGVEQAGRHDHFFELGGHSLMIVSLIERLYDLGWQLDVRSIFSTPVLNEMAQAIQDDTETFDVPSNRIPAHSTHITPDMLPLVSLSQTEIDAIIEATPGGVSNVQDIYPLAPLQEGILFHHLLQEQGDTYLLLSLLAFDNRKRLDTFLTALQQVIDRHDILRTAAYWQGLEQPVQVVWRKAPLHVNSFTPATTENVPAQLLAHTDQRYHRLDLSRAPLFAADIAHDPAQEEWLLALRFHHLVCDHMTLELIFAEIAEIQQGHTETLPAVLPYRNFIAQTLSVPAAVHEAYFRSRLADIDTPTAPFGVLSMLNDHEPIVEAQLLLEPVLAEAIRTQARGLGVSPGVLFHVAWAQVLAQTSGCDDVVFGSVLLGRLSGGIGTARTLGMFINTLPVRISLADRSVQEVIQAAYHNLTALLEHEQAPLVLAQRCSGVTLPMPLFSTLLNYRHSQANESGMIGPRQTGIRLVTIGEQTNYPVTLSVDDFGTNFRLTAQTVTNIDPARVTHYLATAISGLVEALQHNPQQLIRSVPVLPLTERQQLLVDFNATQADFPQNALIHQLFEAQAAHYPDAIAVVFEEQTISYGELNIRANRLAHYLIASGVRPDDRVAICVERSPDMVIGLLAILKAGG